MEKNAGEGQGTGCEEKRTKGRGGEGSGGEGFAGETQKERTKRERGEAVCQKPPSQIL